MGFKQRGHEGSVTDVAADQLVAVIAFQRGKIFRIPGVGQKVEIDHWSFFALNPAQHEI
jgi:hypothetical protein